MVILQILKKVLDDIHMDKETTLTVQKKLLVLDLGLISLQTRT